MKKIYKQKPRISMLKIMAFSVLTYLTFLIGPICSTVLAHDLWINLSKHHVRSGDTVKVFLGWGHNYPFSDFLPIKRLKSMKLITPSDKVLTLMPKEGVPGTEVTASESGTYLVAVAMKPGYYTKTIAGHTFKSKKESKDVISSIWYEKYAKAVFSVDTSDSKIYKKVVGHNLEIIPLNDPSCLRQGDSLSVKVLFKGKPLSRTFVYGSYLGFVGGHAFAYATRTNNAGIASIRLVTPGVWRLMVQHHEPPQDESLCDLMKYTAFFTFETR